MKPPDGFALSELQQGDQYLDQIYSHRFRLIKGSVKAIFLGGLARGYVEAPCAVIEADLPHGMSGGPVFNEAGHVCGITWGSASSFFQHPAAVVSLLYPMLVTQIRISAQMGPLNLAAKRPLIDYITNGTVLTDGSEKGLSVYEEKGDFVVSPRIHGHDTSHVYENLDAYNLGRPANPLPDPIK